MPSNFPWSKTARMTWPWATWSSTWVNRTASPPWRRSTCVKDSISPATAKWLPSAPTSLPSATWPQFQRRLRRLLRLLHLQLLLLPDRFWGQPQQRPPPQGLRLEMENKSKMNISFNLLWMWMTHVVSQIKYTFLKLSLFMCTIDFCW